ncbi:Negative regulator of flagellin synthesis [Azospirillaceae bacterium]
MSYSYTMQLNPIIPAAQIPTKPPEIPQHVKADIMPGFAAAQASAPVVRTQTLQAAPAVGKGEGQSPYRKNSDTSHSVDSTANAIYVSTNKGRGRGIRFDVSA